jgi:hypothetical protein
MSPDSTTQSKTIAGFNGLWNRGLGETCPPDHLQQCNNCIFPGPNQVSIRESVVSYLATPKSGLISFAAIALTTRTAVLGLYSDGSFWDLTSNVMLIAPGSIFGTDANYFPDDFIACNVFGRAYISFKYQGKALPNTSIYYYQLIAAPPGYRFILAGGPPVTTPVTVAEGSATTPQITAGVHYIGVSFLTETGFLTPPLPAFAPGVIDADGLHQLDITDIPISSAPNVVGRVLLMTQANQKQYFFVPNGTINDNTTAAATINVTDLALIESADYLLDIAWQLPACSSIKLYNGRLVLIGPNGVADMPPSGGTIYNYPDNVLVSNQLAPETFNMVTGVVNLPVDYGANNTNTGAIIRNVLYCMKPFGTYAVQDNGGDPSTWSVTVIDSGLGTFDSGLSIFESSASAQDILDQCLVVSPRGLLIFNGAYQDPPLSYKIDGIWRTFDTTRFYTVKLAHDPILKRVYVMLPILGGTVQFLMCDYTEGLGPTTVKWSTWDFDGFVLLSTITKLAAVNMLPYASTTQWQLVFCGPIKYSGISTDIYMLSVPPSTYQAPLPGDLGAYSIKQIIQIANVNFGQGINVFTLLDFSVAGIGKLSIKVVSKKGDITQTVPGFDLTEYNPLFSGTTVTSGMELYRGINFQSEAMSVLLQNDVAPVQLSGYTDFYSTLFELSSITVYGKLMFKTRPSLVQTK